MTAVWMRIPAESIGGSRGPYLFCLFVSYSFYFIFAHGQQQHQRHVVFCLSVCLSLSLAGFPILFLYFLFGHWPLLFVVRTTLALHCVAMVPNWANNSFLFSHFVFTIILPVAGFVYLFAFFANNLIVFMSVISWLYFHLVDSILVSEF